MLSFVFGAIVGLIAGALFTVIAVMCNRVVLPKKRYKMPLHDMSVIEDGINKELLDSVRRDNSVNFDDEHYED